MFWMGLVILAYVSWHSAGRYKRYLERVVAAVKTQIDLMIRECSRCLDDCHRLIGFGHKIEGKLEAIETKVEALQAEAQRLRESTASLQNSAKSRSGEVSQNAVNEILGRP